MMVMTAKVNMKKIVIVLSAAVALILAMLLLLGGHDSATPTAAPSVSDNDTRVKFLSDMGWEVVTAPVQSSQVRIPKTPTEVYNRYNELQKSQGYDLSRYAGKHVMRYVYTITNFEGATQPVYATLLVYKNQIIGGDVTDTGAKGIIQGLRKDNKPLTPSDSSAPSDASAPSVSSEPSESAAESTAPADASAPAPSSVPTTGS